MHTHTLFQTIFGNNTRGLLPLTMSYQVQNLFLTIFCANFLEFIVFVSVFWEQLPGDGLPMPDSGNVSVYARGYLIRVWSTLR